MRAVDRSCLRCSLRVKSLEESAWKGPEEEAYFEMGCEVTS